MTPFEYQKRAVNQVMAHFRNGVNRVCLVCPTGGGKTFMAKMAVDRCIASGKKAAAIAHRVELVGQLRERTSCSDVWTIQGLAKDGPEVEDISLLILDECHHYAADDWTRVFAAFPNAKVLGLTATPERSDGKPLGALFEEMVVAASYSELSELGRLCPLTIVKPDKCMAPDLAANPVDAWLKYAGDRQGFMYVRSVEDAYKYEHDLLVAGVKAAAVVGETPAEQRANTLTRFRNGELRCLVNVFVLTEGIDVPQAEVCCLARGTTHASTLLQMVGRVLRSHPGKDHATWIDLPGMFHVHGSPLEDREYSLGSGILRQSEPKVNVYECIRCGFASGTSFSGKCPKCGFEMPDEFKRNPPKIWDVELREVWNGQWTPDPAKAKEFNRLLTLARGQGFGAWWVSREYRKLFAHDPPSGAYSQDDKRAEFRRAKSESKSVKQAIWKFRDTFGHWPPREWVTGL